MTGLLSHFEIVQAARQRIPRGQESCGCCQGAGTHDDRAQSPCKRCQGDGYVRQGSSEPWCPGREDLQPRRRRKKASAAPYVVFHGAHHDDVSSIQARGLQPASGGGATVTTSRDGAALYGGMRDWTSPKVLEFHVPAGQAEDYLSEPHEGVTGEGTVHALKRPLPPSMLAGVHEASRGEPGQLPGGISIGFEKDYHGRHAVTARDEDGNTAGLLHWHPGSGHVTVLQMNKGYHGNGIATALWNRAHEEAGRYGLVAPVHSVSRTPAADAWAHSVGGEIPPLCEECMSPEWQASLPPESRLRQASAGQFSAITAWGADRPHAAAIHHAQEQTRLDHPMMTMRLPEPDRRGQSAEAGDSLQHMLRRNGYPGDKAEGAWVARKPESATASSTGYDTGERTVGAGLHPHRWDYGTLGHEAAHLLVNHERGYHPAAMAHSMGLGDPDVHGQDFARAYERVIRSSWGDQAGDDFRRHHDDAVKLVSNYRRTVHKLPGIDGPTSHEAADTSYRGYHEAVDPDDGDAMHELGEPGTKTFPADVHEHPDWYGADAESAHAIHRARGNPEAKIRVYRALPKPHRQINSGDWVTPSKEYAKMHAESEGGDHPWPIIRMVVPAKHLRTEGNELTEWAYHGPDRMAMLSHPGGKQGDKGGPSSPHRWTQTEYYGKGNDRDSEAIYGPQQHEAAVQREGVTWHEGMPDLHRGVTVKLPRDVHEVVSDESRPKEERARHLIDHVTREGLEPLGQHWSESEKEARHFTQYNSGPAGARDSVKYGVVFHAHHPGAQHVITDPGWREEHEVNESEGEHPLERHADLEVHGISWRPAAGSGTPWTKHVFSEPQYHEASRNTAAAIPEYGHRPEFKGAPEDWPQDKQHEYHERQFQADRDWRAQTRRGLSMGHLTSDQANELGYHGTGHDHHDPYSDRPTGWQKLPQDLYHVTTSLAGVRAAGGLRSQKEMGIHTGHGLGSSEADSISMTTDPHIAHGILRGLHEYHSFLNHGKPQDLFDKAAAGHGASRPFLHDLLDYHGTKPGEPLRRDLDAIVRGKRTKHSFGTQEEIDKREGPGWVPHPADEPYRGRTDGRPMHSHWERDATPEEALHDRSQLFKEFATFREHAGGHYNPGFMGNDEAHFAKLDPKQFALLHIRPKPGAQGYPLPGEAEWRTTTGDALETHKAERLQDGRMHEASLKPEASMPHPNYDPDEKMPVGRGIYWRAHIKGQPLDEQHARSQPLNDYGLDSAGRRGYSAFRTPHQLGRYMDEMHWIDEGMGNRNAIAFHGEHVGRGVDNEHLVVPKANPNCCGRIIHSSMPWEDLENSIWGEHNPEVPHHDEHVSDPVPKSIERHRRRTAASDDHLTNPHTGGKEWFHGTQAHKEDMKGGFTDPSDFAHGRFEVPESEVDDPGHWNRLLGSHFTADHDVADQFAQGEHSGSSNEGYGDEPEEHEGVVHARLNIKNPKHYPSEHDMDHEAYEHEHAAGNHPIDHLHDPENEEEDEKDFLDEYWPNAMRIHNDYGKEKIPESTYGHHMSPFERHPMRTAWLNTHPDKFGIAERFKKRLQDQGHDGITYGNEYEKSRYGRAGNTSAIAFHPDQAEITQHHHVEEECRMPHTGAYEGHKFYHGTMDPKSLIPTEHQAAEKWSVPGSAGRDYLDKVKSNMAQYGQQTPIDVDYDKRGRDRIPKPYIGQGHHRHRSAIELKLPQIEVSVASAHGVPPGMSNVREITRDEHNQHVNGFRWGDDNGSRTAAAFVPHDRIFGPTHGLDHRLFTEEGELKPEVREAVMEKLDQAIRVDVQITGSEWQDFVTVYLAGSQASEWTSPDLEGNNDFDTLADIDYDAWRGSQPRGDQPLTDDQITSAFNAAMRGAYNDEDWHAPFGGTWHLTGYCNGRPISQIKPYAAYDITHSKWAVKPPHLPDWSPEKFPQGPALFQQARALAAEVRAILRLPEPFRKQEASRIWDYIHQGRQSAFSEEGLGWQDAGNVLEKYLDQVPGHLIDKLKSLKFATAAVTGHLYHSGAKEFPGSEEWVHLGTREAAINRGKDWSEERTRQGKPDVPVYLHTVRLGGRHSLSTETDDAANQEGIGDHLLKSGYTVMPYTNEFEDPGSTSYLAHHSAVQLVNTELLAGTHQRTAAVTGEPMRNPYHGTSQFGGRPEWSHTWFHGTRAQNHPDLSQGRPPEDMESKPFSERVRGQGWPQPNKLLGTHFSPLHDVSHGFARGMSAYKKDGKVVTPGVPSAIVHTELNFRNPAHFPTEHHLNLAMARWADKSYPHWHDDKLNGNLSWNYSDQEGTHRDWHAEPEGRAALRSAGNRAQQVLQWHPHLPEIVKGFTSDLHDRGHHGITYGNEVEGPGNFSKMHQDVRHISAIATHPSQITTTHVEHFAPPGTTTPEHPYKLHGDKDEDGEPEEMNEKITDWHEAHGGEIPREEHAGQRVASAGDIDLYHHTSPEAETSIYQNGFDPELAEQHDTAFFSNRPHSPWEKTRGHGLVHVRVPHGIASDEGGGDYSVHFRDLSPEHFVHDDDGPEKTAALQPGDLERPTADQFIHEVPDHESWLDQFRVHRGKYLLHDSRPGMITAYRIGQHGLQHPDARTGHPKPRRAGYLTWFGGGIRRKDDGTPDDSSNINGGVIYKTQVSGPHRRKGVASAMLAFARELHPELEIRHSRALSEDGKEWASKVAGGSGDRYVRCDQGHTHWGAHGAAGLLVRHKGDDGQQRYLLQKRSEEVQHGGTWSTPGGALHAGEEPKEGALREAREELGPLPRDLTHHHTVTDDHGGWAYHTVVMDSPRRFTPKGGGSTDFEHAGHGWFSPPEVKDLDLHPGFAASWDKVRRSRTDKTAAARSYRLWRGEGGLSGKPVSKDHVGRWFTPNRITAEDYAYKNSGHLYHLDVTAQDKKHITQPDAVWDGIKSGGSVTVHVDPELASRKEHHSEGCPSCDPGHDETHYHQREWLKRQGKTAAARKLYHGTSADFGPGDVVQPSSVSGHPLNWGQSDPDYAYATGDRQYAASWAHETAMKTGSPMRVYHVEPVDHSDLERDRRPGARASWKSPSGFRVIQEEEFTRPKTAALDVKDYDGTTGDRSHITRSERGMIPTSAVAGMRGGAGEVPGEHRNRQGQRWEDFKADIAANGIRNPVFITVDHGEDPKLSEGSHRRDAAVELGLSHVPAEIRYFGHAEQQGTVLDRVKRQASRHTAAGQLPPGYAMEVQQEDETRWGHPALHLNVSHGGKPVAGLGVFQRPDPETGSLAGNPNVWVHPDHQRKGLGTAMYAEVHRRWPGIPVKHSPHSSEDARALNQALKERFGPDLHYGRKTAAAMRGPFFHGTDREFKSGDHIVPGHKPVWDSSSRDKSYFTSNLDHADMFAYSAAHQHNGTYGGHVYEVEPSGPYQEDRTVTQHGVPVQAYQTSHPLKVLRKVLREDRPDHARLAAATKTKDQVNYRPADGPRRCGNCVMFRLHPPDFEAGACTLVQGIIDEDATCDRWASEGKTAAARDQTDTEPNRAVHAAVEEHVRGEHPHLDQEPEDRTGTLRKMFGRASFFMPREDIDSAEPPEHARSVNDLAHHAAHVMTDTRHAREEARPREAWESSPRPSELDPDERRHGKHFTWHYALALDGAGHQDAADTARKNYTGSLVGVANERHSRGLSRDFPGSGLSPHRPPDQGDLPPMIKSQREAFASDDDSYSRKMLDVASNPEPGLRLWRGERRPAGDDIAGSRSVGMHWSAKPEAVITARDRGDDSRPVVWQSRLEHPGSQAIPRSHPMWSGIHQSMPSEAEVRLRPGSSVHVEGAWVGEKGADSTVHPLHPEHNPPGWTWHPVGRHVMVSHRPGGQGTVDYSEFGMPREGAVRNVPSRHGPDGKSGGLMVAIVPPPEVLDHLQEAMVPLDHKTEDRAKMHVTVLYLGTEEDHTDAELDKLPELVRQWCKTVAPFEAKIQGSGTFHNAGSHPVLALVDVPGEARHLHHSLVTFLAGHGIGFPQDHSWIPHVTLAYSPSRVRFLPKLEKMSFPVKEAWYCRAGRWESFPLTGR